MTQADWIGLFLIAAFLIFITARGDLPAYFKVFI